MSGAKHDPLACFGDSSDSDSDEDNDHNLDASSNLEQAYRLREQSNKKNQPISITPITNDPSFEVFDAGPLSGNGLRATQKYKCGDEIMREYAAMRLPNSHPASSLEAAQVMHKQAAQRAYNSMHHTTKTAFMDLSSCDEEEASKTPYGIYDTNSFRLEDGKTNDGALFLTIARINHSCHPNVNHIWRDDLQQMLVFACRDIEIGDEIFSSYGPGECMITQHRREYLSDRFSFECRCTMCMEGNLKGGDERMIEIQSLQQDIALSSMISKDSANSVEKSLESVTKCLKLMEEQGIGRGVYTKTIYHHGYTLCMAYDDAEGAKSFLLRELKAVQDSEGVDSPRAVEIEHVLNV